MIMIFGPNSSNKPSLAARLVSRDCSTDSAKCEYALSIDDRGSRQTGCYRVVYAARAKDGRQLLTLEAEFQFDKPVPFDVCVEQAAVFLDRQPTRLSLPQRNGVVKTLLASSSRATGYFTLGRGAAPSQGHELAMPVVGMAFEDEAETRMSVATDPYCGVQFTFSSERGAANSRASITLSTRYRGTLVPVKQESRTFAFSIHKDGIDGMLNSFYSTIPQIEPGPTWIHAIQLNYYDYLGRQGRAWFEDLQKLADKIPQQHRDAVVVNLHGWYDYLGRYSFDRKSRELEDQWIAFPRTRKTPMSKTEIRKRIRFAKELGFRAVLYFADGLNSDSGMPGFREDWLLEDEHGDLRKGWTGPSTGATYAMDPSNPEVRQFFLDYATALLREYGSEIDGLVWDETQYIAQEKLSAQEKGLAYADRDFMKLVAEITQLVQRRRSGNNDLVFLTSDCISGWGNRRVPYALVSHGTYQDTACNPQAWPPGLLPNYRNCLWSCNWYPLKHRDWNRIAAEEYGLPQGLSCGYGDDVGPNAMPEELLDEVIQRFLVRVKRDDRRPRYLTKATAHTAPNTQRCTTEQDAAGGCDGIKTGTWGFCTEREVNPWWQVDLGNSIPLDRVVIYNRCDGNVEDRAARLRLILSDDGRRWTEAYQHDGTAFLGYTDNKPLTVPFSDAAARFVRIQLPSTEHLHLDEVELYQPNNPNNIALGKPANQSSTSRWSTPQPATPVPSP
ncbi:MAG: discoidin domain-containing protein [Planctomycetes bacterium]|nr:discoidin domain-containing protein [Planctomycetota bacterium]MBL7044135.1 discoidin domain-containing protein [Pirellulaceae bacterium]